LNIPIAYKERQLLSHSLEKARFNFELLCSPDNKLRAGRVLGSW